MNLLEVGSYTAALLSGLEVVETMRPWDAAEVTSSLLSDAMGKLPDAFERRNDIAVHRSAQIHPSVVISGPAIVDAGAVIGPHAVLRDGVFIGSDARIGASVEIK